MIAHRVKIDIESSAEVLRVLGHETRLRLLLLLAAGEHAVSEIDAVSGIGQPGLSQQLAILRKAHLVTTRRAAKQVYYRVAPDALQRTASLLAQLAGSTAAAEPTPAPGARKLTMDREPTSANSVASSAAGFARML